MNCGEPSRTCRENLISPLYSFTLFFFSSSWQTTYHLTIPCTIFSCIYYLFTSFISSLYPQWRLKAAYIICHIDLPGRQGSSDILQGDQRWWWLFSGLILSDLLHGHCASYPGAPLHMLIGRARQFSFNCHAVQMDRLAAVCELLYCWIVFLEFWQTDWYLDLIYRFCDYPTPRPFPNGIEMV